MLTDCVIRFLRRKIVLGIIFGLSLCYSIYSFTKGSQYSFISRSMATVDENPTTSLNSDVFIWNSDKVNQNSASAPRRCRNSVQGKFFIVDDEGYICGRNDVLENGCCKQNSSDTNRYVCDTCSEDGCCIVYEHCLSCCMDPSKKPLLENVLSKAQTGLQLILSAVRDQFELCSAKCRTNSMSVFHENSYRNPGRKFCYG